MRRSKAEIERRAYELYLARDREEGKALDHWLDAKLDLFLESFEAETVSNGDTNNKETEPIRRPKCRGSRSQRAKSFRYSSLLRFQLSDFRLLTASNTVTFAIIVIRELHKFRLETRFQIHSSRQRADSFKVQENPSSDSYGRVWTCH